jgi:hypothetical protein
LWLLRSKGGTEKSENRGQNQDASSYGIHGSDSWLGLPI